MQPPGPLAGPLMILPPFIKQWGHIRRQGLCSHPAHLRATSNSSLCSEAVGPPRARGQALCSHPAHLCATSDSATCY